MTSTPVSSLGTTLHTFRYDPEQRKVLVGVALLFAALAFAFPALYTLDPAAVGEVPLYFSPLLVLASIAIGLYLLHIRRLALTFHVHGFEYRGVAVPYADIRAIRYELIHVIGGAATYNRGFLSIRLADGREIRPSIQLESMERVIGGILDGAHEFLVEGMAAEVARGGSVQCGPFELRREGLLCKGKSIPWERAALSSAGSNEAIQLLDVDPDEGEYVKVHEAKIARVENVRALESLVEKLRADAIRRRPA